MATENNTTKTAEGGRTDLLELAKRCHTFYRIPTYDAHLFFVPMRLGPDLAGSAALVAAALESAVQDQMQQSAAEGLPGDLCFLFSFALEAAHALREAAETSRAPRLHDA